MRIANGIYWVGSGAVGLSAEGDCHTYVIESGKELAMVDCGMSPIPETILRNMVEDGLDPSNLRYVLLTHAHPDHAGGCAYLKKVYGAKVVCSAYEGQTLKHGPVDFLGLQGDRKILGQWQDMPRCEPDQIMDDGDVIHLGGIKIQGVLTSGHTKGSMCYLTVLDGRPALFSGDTIFYKGFISVLSPPFSDFNAYHLGLEKLSDYRIEGLFPGHLMWVLKGGQSYIDSAIQAFREYRLPPIKPFS